MKKIIGLIILIYCAACSNLEKNPGEIQTNIRSADVYAFKFAKDSIITAVLIETHLENDTHWYGFAFTNIIGKDTPSIEAIEHGKIYGRKVESAIDPKGYEVGLDLIYLKDSLFNAGNIHKIGAIKLDFTKFNIAAYGFAQSYRDVEISFDYGRMRRKDPPDHYTQSIEKLDKFRPDQYFEIADFLH